MIFLAFKVAMIVKLLRKKVYYQFIKQKKSLIIKYTKSLENEGLKNKIGNKLS